jgi:sugar phosphate isomerase/epimerase
MSYSKHTYGVSPAFFISAYSEAFTIQDVCSGLHRIQQLGYQAYQPEVFLPERLEEWVTGGWKLVHEHGRDLGLVPSQFVAHFLMHTFDEPEQIMSDTGTEELKQVFEMAQGFAGCKTVTIPMGRTDRSAIRSVSELDHLQRCLIDKISKWVDLCEKANLSLAFEVLPMSMIGGTEGLIRIIKEIGSTRLGLNYDTGHAWAMNEEVAMIPFQLTERIFGTHLCDNSHHPNLSLPVGEGNIDWRTVLRNLIDSGYEGSLDLEIRCEEEAVDASYTTGLANLKRHLNNTRK